jgi:vacuolar iron transporter family protein
MSFIRRYDKLRDHFKTKVDAKIDAKIYTKESESRGSGPHPGAGQYIKSAVYGGLDGTVTTFSIVAGVAGAALSPGVVLIMGFANLIGDGFGMAIGDYLSTEAEKEFEGRERKMESQELKNSAQGEKKELESVYTHKGLSKKDAIDVVEKMSKHTNVFVDTVMEEELGVSESKESPMRNAIVTFFSFLLFGIIPLTAYLIGLIFHLQFNSFLVAVLLTGLTLFTLGAVKTKITGKNWLKSGLEMFIIGAIAAGASYLVGYLLHGLA